MKPKALIKALCLFISSSLLFSMPAHAYVDPGSGSAITTAILGILAAITYSCRKFFYNLKSKIFKSSTKEVDRALDDE